MKESTLSERPSVEWRKMPAAPGWGAGYACYLLTAEPTTPPREIVAAARVFIPAEPASREAPFRLKILHVNDLHGHVARLTRSGPQPVFSHIAGRARQLRQRYEDDPQRGVLFVSAGDDTTGSAFDELIGNQHRGFECHPTLRLYRDAGLHAAAPGTHDLNLGTEALAQALAVEAAFPVLCANLEAPPPLKRFIHPAALFDVKGVLVAVIGVTTPARPRPAARADFVIGDPVPVVQQLAQALRQLAQVVIVLSHLGYDRHAPSATVTGVGDVELARALPRGSVDLIVGGHSHHVLNEEGLAIENIVNGIPIVQAGSLGRFLGEVTITVKGAVAVTDARLKPVAELPADPAFENGAVRPVVEMIQPLLSRRLGIVDAHPDFSQEAVQNDFAGGESALANFIAGAMAARLRGRGLPVDFAMLDRGVVHAGLASGALRFADWFRVMPYADTIRVCSLTGWQLLALLEDNARRLDSPRDAHVERGFLHFSEEIRYTILQRAARADNEVVEACFRERPLREQLDRRLTVACHSYFRMPAQPWAQRARESGLQLLNESVLHFRDTGLYLRDEVVRYIEDQGGVRAGGGAARDGRLTVLGTHDSAASSVLVEMLQHQ